MDLSFLNDLPQDLQSEIRTTIVKQPDSYTVFQKLIDYFNRNDAQDLKRRNTEQNLSVINSANVIFRLENVSVMSPVRKKMELILHLASDDNSPRLSLVKDGKPEFSIIDLRENITFAAFLPYPEKDNLIYLFINFKSQRNNDFELNEPFITILNKQNTLTQFIDGNLIGPAETSFLKCIEYMRKQAILTGFRINNSFYQTVQDPDVGSSFYVECHRTTKEGTLFFLPDVIIFGFKRPVLFFKSSNIESITYSSITRLTFNVTLTTKDDKKFEFSMIDQNEFNNIDEYVKRKQVIDKSMSEENKAKRMGKNAAEMEATPSALQEAAQKLGNTTSFSKADFDSDDDENDENFEANSENNSEDSNSSEDDLNNSEQEMNDPHLQANLMKELQGNLGGVENDEFVKALQQGHEFTPVTPSFANIPIEVEDEDEDEDIHDEEGSGVEYD